MWPLRRIVTWSALVLPDAFLLIQRVPYGRDHTNPSSERTINWDGARTEELMRGAGMDCHSNETEWP